MLHWEIGVLVASELLRLDLRYWPRSMMFGPDIHRASTCVRDYSGNFRFLRGSWMFARTPADPANHTLSLAKSDAFVSKGDHKATSEIEGYC